jgi:hypothetical protein
MTLRSPDRHPIRNPTKLRTPATFEHPKQLAQELPRREWHGPG